MPEGRRKKIYDVSKKHRSELKDLEKAVSDARYKFKEVCPVIGFEVVLSAVATQWNVLVGASRYNQEPIETERLVHLRRWH